MCSLKGTLHAAVTALALSPAPLASASTSDYFRCSRLNNSTFQIVENDKYSQIPFIYAKVYKSTVVLIDTGCGGKSDDPRDSLKTFLETTAVADNGESPINAERKPYTIINTHCHFDHIGGLEPFAQLPSTTIWASENNRCFLSPRQLPRTSLCVDVGMKTPTYTITNWAEDGQTVTDCDGLDLNLTIYHAPGHTPDQIAIWDRDEAYLFVGDTIYDSAPIYFLLGGSLFDYSNTLAKLAALVDGWNVLGEKSNRRVQLAAGHLTSGVDAAAIITKMNSFLCQVMDCKITPINNIESGLGTRTYASASNNLSWEGKPYIFDDFLGSSCL